MIANVEYRTHINMSLRHQFSTELDAQRLQLQVVDHHRQSLLVFNKFELDVAGNYYWGRFHRTAIFFLVRLSGIPLSSLTSFQRKTANDLFCHNWMLVSENLTTINCRLRICHHCVWQLKLRYSEVYFPKNTSSKSRVSISLLTMVSFDYFSDIWMLRSW